MKLDKFELDKKHSTAEMKQMKAGSVSSTSEESRPPPTSVMTPTKAASLLIILTSDSNQIGTQI